MSVVRSAALILVTVAVLGSCGGSGDEPREALEELTLTLPESADALLVSLPIDPERRLRISSLDVQASPGLETRYVGYVTRCGGLCGVHAWNDDLESSVENAVEGEFPIEAGPDLGQPNLLFLLSPDEQGQKVLADGDCLSVRAVRLDAGEDDPIQVTRSEFQFLWVIQRDEAECLGNIQLVR